MKNPLDEIYHADSPFSVLSTKVLQEMRDDGLLREYKISAGDSLAISVNANNDSFYLAYGEVDVIEDNKVITHLSAREKKRNPVHLRNFSNITFLAQQTSALIRINQEYLDYYISWKTFNHKTEEPSDNVKDILSHMRQPTLFMSLPMENIDKIIQKMRVTRVKAGEEVITQGQPADNFYIIARGQAEVWQSNPDSGVDEKVNHLYAGNHFGQDALIVEGSLRTASVRMLKDSTLLVLSGDDFKKLVGEPLLHEINGQQASDMMEKEDVRLLDVRYLKGSQELKLADAQVIPLTQLRQRLSEIEQHKKYIIFDNTGKLSAVAALILQQNGVQAFSLSGGLVKCQQILELKGSI